MQLTNQALLLAAISTLSAALPAPESLSIFSKPAIFRRALVKRVDFHEPKLGDGIDKGDPHRGGKLLSPAGSTSGAFANALELMNYATTTTGHDPHNAVFAKYFNQDDHDKVIRVFQRLLGDDGETGAPALENIVVIKSDTAEADFPAELEGYNDPDPKLHLTEDAWVYPNRDEQEDPCNRWDDEGMTQDMLILGSIFVHEYSHWDWFLGTIHNGKVEDQEGGRGWEGARALDKKLAPYNADSYNWFATELFWAVICSKEKGWNAPGVEKRGVGA